MARNHDRYRVCTVGGADRSHRSRISKTPGDLTVAYGLSMRYESDLLPHTFLKVGSLKTELEIEIAARACEIIRQLDRHPITAIAIGSRGFMLLSVEENSDEAIEAVDDNGERSDLGRYGVLKQLLSQ